MKKLAVFIFINLIIISNSIGQENIDLKDLKTPSSPGFQILDIAPTSIERPTNPKEFALSVMNLTSNGTVIPKNFAVEFSPFWYVKSNTTSIYKYLNIENKENSNIFSGLFRKMSISLASVSSDSTAANLIKKTNYIAFGIRTNIITYRSKQQSEKINNALNEYSKRVKELRAHQSEIDELEMNLQNNLIKTDSLASNYKDAKEENIIKAKQDYENSLKEQAVIQFKISTLSETLPDQLEKNMDKDEQIKEYYSLFQTLPLFQVDAAFAYSEALPNNESGEQRFNRSGIWINAALNAFSLNEELKDNLTMLFSAKIISDNLLESNTTNIYKRQNAFDLGFKLQYLIKNLSISYEYLKRNYANNSNLNSERSVGVIEYKISDGVFINGTFGNNFGNSNKLFTLFGINYGFGKSKLNIKN